VSAQGKAQEHENSWHALLSTTAKGEIKACEGNIVIALENHPAWKGILAHNDRTQQTMFMRQPPIEACVGPFPRAITDADGVQIAKWFTIETRITMSGKQCLPAAFSVGRSVIYDPFREWLESLPPWDGISRAETWLITCAGAIDCQYTREVSLRWLLQAVWRTYAPGCQADYTLILQGPQGIKKSTLLAALLPDPSYFVDHLPHVGTKDATIALQGPVIIEIAELSAFKRSESEGMKAFLTTKYDSVRLPYDKLNTVLPRRCVIAGTTNDDAYLRDATGNRRYWPVSVTSCDPACLTANREQLWAELVARFKAGDRCYLDQPTEALAVLEQDGRYEGDLWEQKIDTWLNKEIPKGAPAINHPHPAGISLTQICEHALQIDDTSKWNRAAEMRVVAILKQRKYVRVRRVTHFSGGRAVWVYVKND
jgi:putative DNA primase/helicase